MNTLALQEIATTHPSISCVHVFPSLVITPGFRTFAADWPGWARALFEWIVLPCVKLFTVGLPESGERHAFHATSARYPPAHFKDEAGAGVPLTAGVEVAQGSDGQTGSGCYLLNYNGEVVGDKKLLKDYRKKDWGKKIWEHTQEVFNKAEGSGNR